jgi:predicted DNA-binding protein (UPF0251 family)
VKKLPLTDYVKDRGQANAAAELGVHQTAISKALRIGRNVVVTQMPDGSVTAEEIRPFPSQRHQAA